MMTVRSQLFVLCTVLVGAPATAQGYISWADANEPLHGMVMQTGPGTYSVTFRGWTTRASALDDDDYQATGLGTSLVKTVTGSEITQEENGGEMQLMPLFDLREDPDVGNAFNTARPAPHWTGFLANVRRAVPDFERAGLTFDLATPLDLAGVIADLNQSIVAIAESNADGTQLGPRLDFFVPQVKAARILEYGFDRGNGPIAVNYGLYGYAPRTGTMQTDDLTAWEAGWGWTGSNALRGASIVGGVRTHTYCDTGWQGGPHGSLHGSFTVAFYLRERTPTGGQVSHIFGGLGGLRCFTGGSAGQGLWCQGWGGSTLTTADDIQGKAAQGWVHVALVVSGGNQARWYVDGVSAGVQGITAQAQIAGPGRFLIGSAGNAANASTFDIDEFRLVGDAVGLGVIQSWRTQPPARETTFGMKQTCGAILRSTGGAPALNNAAYFLRVEGPPNSPFALLLGVQTAGLPIDLGFLTPNLQGCLLYTDGAVVAMGNTGANGLARQRLPLSILTGPAEIYAQVGLLYNGVLRVSNPHASAVR